MEGHTGLGPFVAGEAEPPGEFKERVVDNVVCGSDRRFDILRPPGIAGIPVQAELAGGGPPIGQRRTDALWHAAPWEIQPANQESLIPDVQYPAARATSGVAVHQLDATARTSMPPITRIQDRDPVAR